MKNSLHEIFTDFRLQVILLHDIFTDWARVFVHFNNKMHFDCRKYLLIDPDSENIEHFMQ